MSDQFIRKCSLVVSPNQFGGGGSADQGPVQDGASQGLEIADLRIVFKVCQADVDAPNTLQARVYNLSKTTSDRIRKEFQHVALQAGYEGGQMAVIFEGTIKQFRRGRENATDTFLDIFAADGDAAYNFAIVNKTLAAGSKAEDRIKEIVKSMEPYRVSAGTIDIPLSQQSGGTLPRGKVLFAMARDRLTDEANAQGVTWSIQNGKVQVIPLTGYLPDEALVLNSRTGMIGVPEATQNGIEVTCLLNPRIKIGTRVQIDNASVNQTTVLQQGFPRYTDLSFPAAVTDDGFYRVLVVEHRGDSRGQEWYSTLTCLAVDPSSQPNNSVLTAG